MHKLLHSSRKKSVFIVGKNRRSGMTLLEVMISLSLMLAALVGFSYLALGTAALNRRTEVLVAATNTISKQLSAITAVANSTENRREAGTAAKALVLYLRTLKDVVDPKISDDYPVRVDWLDSEGVIRYEFPISAPGAITGDITTVNAPAQNRQSETGRGVMYVYLMEDKVPTSFYDWKTYRNDGTTIPNSFSHFDMDGDGEPHGDFTDLKTLSASKYRSSKLKTIPISVTVQYYSKASDLALARDWEAANPGRLYRSDSYASFSLTRDYVINDASVLGLGIY